MNLSIHESIHFVSSLVIGFLLYLFLFPHSIIISLFASLAGGFLIDMDHLFDYFMAFGFRLKLSYFFKGYQFSKSDRLYIPLHSYELTGICITLFAATFQYTHYYYIASIGLTISISMLTHLILDVFLNRIPFKTYSLVYRMTHGFMLKYLVSRKHYEEHLRKKRLFKCC